MLTDKISIILPIYNEASVVKKTIDDIRTACQNAQLNFEIIAVNDGSTDQTSQILHSIDNIRIINHHVNQGYGSALKSGIKEAQGDWIVITDVDGTYPNKDIPKLIEYLPDYDMVVGARKGKVIKDWVLKHSAKKFLNKFASYLTGKKVIDINSGLRVFKKSIALEYWHLFPNRFSFSSTMTMVCFTNGYQVKYVPIDYYKRVGKSYLKPKNFIDFVNLLIKLSLFFKPIKVFSLLSLIIFILGLVVGLYTTLILGKLADVITILLIITALQTFYFGLLAEIVIKSKK